MNIIDKILYTQSCGKDYFKIEGTRKMKTINFFATKIVKIMILTTLEGHLSATNKFICFQDSSANEMSW